MIDAQQNRMWQQTLQNRMTLHFLGERDRHRKLWLSQKSSSDDFQNPDVRNSEQETGSKILYLKYY